jgi:hypothetical protein
MNTGRDADGWANCWKSSALADAIDPTSTIAMSRAFRSESDFGIALATQGKSSAP